MGWWSGNQTIISHIHYNHRADGGNTNSSSSIAVCPAGNSKGETTDVLLIRLPLSAQNGLHRSLWCGASLRAEEIPLITTTTITTTTTIQGVKMLNSTIQSAVLNTREFHVNKAVISGKCPVQFSIRTQANLTQVFHGFPHSFVRKDISSIGLWPPYSPTKADMR